MPSKKTLKLIDQANAVIDKNGGGPFTLRQIHYQFVTNDFYENTPESYSKLSRICVIGRELGLLPEEAFVDRMRPFHIKSQWNNTADFLSSVQRAYRKDFWKDQSNYIELWLEKDALLGVVQPIADQFHIGLQGGRGYVSYTVIQKAAERFQRAFDVGKTCHLLYAGDFDPSGENIFDALDNKMRDRHKIDFIQTKRIALNENQVKKYTLPSALPKPKDSRTKGFIERYGNISVELDALPPKVFQDLVKQEFNALTDIGLFKKSHKEENSDRKTLQSLITRLQLS